MVYGMKVIVAEFERVVQEILKRVGLRPSFGDKIELKIVNGSLIIMMPKYYKYVDSGRKRGSFPPIGPLMNWILEKNINVPNGMTQKQFAYAIATNIKKRGIKARPFREKMREALSEILQTYITNRVLNIKIK